MLLAKTTAAQNEVALSYHRVRGIYFLTVVFAATIFIVSAIFDYYLLLIKIDIIIIHLLRNNGFIEL